MNTRPLGPTGKQVSSVGLGTMPLAIAGRPEGDAAVAVIHAALDAGMTWLDTANSYCKDESDVGYGERLVARALETWHGPRERIIVTTKGGWRRPRGEWEVDAHPARLKAACEASLKALGVSSIFLYQLHAPDPKVYFPDSVGALADLKREGKIVHVGLCNVDLGHVKDARRIVHVATIQNRCNPVERHCYANGIVDYATREGIAFIPHSPVGGHRGHGRIASDPALVRVGARHEASPYQVAIAWLLASTPMALPIPGASRVESARSSARAAEIALSEEDRAELARAFPAAPFVMKQLVRLRRKARQIVRNARRSS